MTILNLFLTIRKSTFLRSEGIRARTIAVFRVKSTGEYEYPSKTNNGVFLDCLLGLLFSYITFHLESPMEKPLKYYVCCV